MLISRFSARVEAEKPKKVKKYMQHMKQLNTLLDSATFLAFAVQNGAMKKHHKLNAFPDSATLLAPGVQHSKTYEKQKKPINSI